MVCPVRKRYFFKSQGKFCVSFPLHRSILTKTAGSAKLPAGGKGASMEINKQSYGKYVKEVTPSNQLWKAMGAAFLTGGSICLLGQVLLNVYQNGMGLEKETAGAFMQLSLILLSILLTGFSLYPKLVKFGGAGALVPITGFANSVAAPAIEFHSEGEVFGVGCKIFTIAGPVILYGLLASWILGVIYWAAQTMGLL